MVLDRAGRFGIMGFCSLFDTSISFCYISPLGFSLSYLIGNNCVITIEAFSITVNPDVLKSKFIVFKEN